jgi:hypothetical protein
MMEKHCLKMFIADIDKIISGESVIPFACEHGGEEYQELLGLAELLAKADYTSKSRMEKIWANFCKTDELQEDELDMVAGGINPDAVLGEKDNKNNI